MANLLYSRDIVEAKINEKHNFNSFTFQLHLKQPRFAQ